MKGEPHNVVGRREPKNSKWHPDGSWRNQPGVRRDWGQWDPPRGEGDSFSVSNLSVIGQLIEQVNNLQGGTCEMW